MITNKICLSQPESCGAAGGAVSMWLKIIDCYGAGGILETNNIDRSLGFVMFCWISEDRTHQEIW